MLVGVTSKWHKWLPFLFLGLVAVSRWPGLMPQNFSAVYALVFCAGAFFPRNVKWWLPLGMILATDIALNLYYGAGIFNKMQAANYAAYAFILWFGTRFNRKSSFFGLLSGGILGAFIFYFVTNTASWLFNPFNNPEYSKDFMGWIIALTKGHGNYPTTIQFFINTLLSGGLFTGLFAGAMKMSEAAESAKEKEEEPEEAEAPEGEPVPEEN
jgi:hypothetical protein